MYKQKKIAYNKYKRKVKEEKMKVIDKIALVLIIIGAINWGLIGFFNFNLVAVIFGEMTWISRVIYALVGISGLWGIKLLFDD
jgi:uncharacterized membrane protein YuzA (DUF378 family)